MIYSALCLDNTKYFETGKILVRIFQYYVHPRKDKDGNIIEFDDLSKYPDLREEGKVEEGLYNDFEAFVFAPLGGGRNYGMFSLPRINEKGLVTFLDGDMNKPLWLGSYFAPMIDKDYKTAGVNIPNDKPEEEGSDKDGSINGEKKIEGDERTIILRTKHTTSEDADHMDWEQRNTENLVVVGDSKVRVRHFTEWDNNEQKKYQEIMIYKDSDNDDKETVVLDVNNIKDTKRGILKLTEDGFRVEISDSNGTSVFEFTAEGDTAINFTDKFGNTILGTQDGLELNGNADTMVLYSDLKEILNYLKKHTHAGAIIVGEPLVSKNERAPVSSKIDKKLTDMEADHLFSKHYG